MVERGDWDGAFIGIRTNSADTSLTMVIGRSSAGGAGAFKGLGEDDTTYWIKPTNNHQSAFVPIAEQIVGRVGALIAAPVCTVRTIEIPQSLAGTLFSRNGGRLEPGLAHASVNIKGSEQTYDLDYRNDDDNRRRHCGVHALYDWCWGKDKQWLVAEDRSYHSHDHGAYLEPAILNSSTIEALQELHQAHELSNYYQSIGASIADEVATRLEELSHEQIAKALAEVPTSWLISDNDLESIGFFLEYRAPQVATRLRQNIVG